MSEDEFLPMLSYVLKNGNVTVYQWEHGEPPVPDQNQTLVPSVNGCEPNIDWGVGLESVDTGVVQVAQDDGIDFGGMDFGDASRSNEDDKSFIILEESGVGGVVLEEEGLGGVEQQPAAESVEKREYNGKT